MNKNRSRYTAIADLWSQAIKLFHLNRADFPFINFQSKRLRLDQNDGTCVPLAQIPENLAGKNAEVRVQQAGQIKGQRPQLNFIAGTGIKIMVTDDPENNRINIIIST